MFVLRPGEPKDWHFGVLQAEVRVPDFPVDVVVRQGLFVVVRNLVEAAAPVHRDGERVARVDADHRGCDDATPRHSHDANLVRIDFGQVAEQGGGERHVCHTLIHPLVFNRSGLVPIDTRAYRAAFGVSCMAFVAFLVGMAFKRHADGREPLIGPDFDPVLRGCAAAAVNQDNGRNLAFWVFRSAEPGKNLRGFPLEIRSRVEDWFEIRRGIRPVDHFVFGSLGELGKRFDLGAHRFEVGGRGLVGGKE